MINKNTEKRLILRRATTASALAGLALSAQAAGPTPASDALAWQKPAWLTDLSLSLREGYDDNVFMTGADPKVLPAYSVTAGSIAALENHSSWLTTVSPRVGVDFAPLLGDQKTFEALSLAYAPDFFIYHDLPWQSYDAHRFLTAIKGQAGNLSFNAANTLTYIDGSDYGPTFPGGGNYYNAWASVIEGQRVKQLQDLSKISVRYDWDKFFVRPTASLTYFDVMSQLLDLPELDGHPNGYQNYPDRYDVNGGADFGYKVTPETALTLGYRYGHQYQQQMSFSPDSSPSDYQRLLLGAEGKPLKWLTMSLQGGPDFRSYAPDTATHTTPVNDLHPVKYYGEGTVSVQPSSKDTIAFNYKAYQWVSICGKVPYFDNRYELSYHRSLFDKLTLDLGARAWDADFTSGNLSSSKRDDMLYNASAGLTWAATAHFDVNLTYTANLGRNFENMVDAQYRDYDQDLVSLGLKYKF
ncbi:MAG: hypothetical protein ACLQVY_17110 [Limisphaerales bacterium]